MITVHAVDEWLHPTEFYKQSKSLMESGYSLDFISDEMIAKSMASNGLIQTSDQNSAKVLIIPDTEFMPIETLKNILKLAENGASVIFQSKPRSIPGHHAEPAALQAELDQLWNSLNFENGKSAHGNGSIILSDDIPNALEAMKIHRETLVDSGLDFIRRKAEDGTYYFLVNHSASDIQQIISLNKESESVMILDPLTGKRGKVNTQISEGKTSIPVYLKSGESIFIKVFNDQANLDIPEWPDYSKSSNTLDISNSWILTFEQGQPALPESMEMDKIGP